MRRTWQRELALRTLYENGGRVYSDTGQATGLFHDLMGVDTTQQATTQLLTALEGHGLIERSINGRRCYEIKLKELPSGWDIADEPEALHVEQLEASIADMIIEDEYVSEPMSMADKLLEKIKHSLNDLPDYEHLIAELTQERDHYKQRLAAILDENQRLRSRVDPLQDEVKAQKEIASGLRRQINDLENNIRTLAKNDSEITHKMRNLKDFQRFISEAPRPGAHV